MAESNSSEYVKSKFQKNVVSPDVGSRKDQILETQSNGNSYRTGDSQRPLVNRNGSLKSSMKNSLRRNKLSSDDHIMEVNISKGRRKKVVSVDSKKKNGSTFSNVNNKSAVKSPNSQTTLVTSGNQNGKTQVYEPESNTNKGQGSNKVKPMGAGWYRQTFGSLKNKTKAVDAQFISHNESKFNKEVLVKEDIGIHKKIYIRKDRFDFNKYTEDIFE